MIVRLGDSLHYQCTFQFILNIEFSPIPIFQKRQLLNSTVHFKIKEISSFNYHLLHTHGCNVQDALLLGELGSLVSTDSPGDVGGTQARLSFSPRVLWTPPGALDPKPGGASLEDLSEHVSQWCSAQTAPGTQAAGPPQRL